MFHHTEESSQGECTQFDMHHGCLVSWDSLCHSLDRDTTALVVQASFGTKVGDMATNPEPSSSNSSPNELTTPLARRDVQYLSRTMRGEWENVGRNLHITEGELYKFRSDYGRREQEAIYQMLLHWRQKEGENATRKTLAKALRRERSKELANFVLTGVKSKTSKKRKTSVKPRASVKPNTSVKPTTSS